MWNRRILLVDDHPLFRSGLRRVLAQDPRLEIVAEAASGHEALRAADQFKPALVILDVFLPGVTGLRVAQALRRQWPATSIMLLSTQVDEEHLFQAIQAGAAAFLTKDTDQEEILASVQAVLRGENLLQAAVHASPTLARRVLGQFRAIGNQPGADDPDVTLSQRELEVLDCLVMGRSNKEIAATLFISEQTVKNHITAVLRKLEVSDRVAALRYAVTHGWVTIGETGDRVNPRR